MNRVLWFILNVKANNQYYYINGQELKARINKMITDPVPYISGHENDGLDDI